MSSGSRGITTRPFTVTIRATSLAEAMVRADQMLTSPTVEVVEIVDAGLQVGDSYIVTALVREVPAR